MKNLLLATLVLSFCAAACSSGSAPASGGSKEAEMGDSTPKHKAEAKAHGKTAGAEEFTCYHDETLVGGTCACNSNCYGGNCGGQCDVNTESCVGCGHGSCGCKIFTCKCGK